MSLISFLKEAGEKLTHGGGLRQNGRTEAGVPAIKTPPADMQGKEKALEQAILDYMAAQNLPIQGVNVKYDSSNARVVISGEVPDQATREKIVLCCGSVQGVSNVDDRLTMAAVGTDRSQWYTLQSGDSLSKIAQDVYGDLNEYNRVFEANQPMLSDPNRIYPGQVLRIPVA